MDLRNLNMTEFLVRYTINTDVYESVVRTSSSGSAIRWVSVQFPNAISISVVGSKY